MSSRCLYNDDDGTASSSIAMMGLKLLRPSVTSDDRRRLGLTVQFMKEEKEYELFSKCKEPRRLLLHCVFPRTATRPGKIYESGATHVLAWRATTFG
jgi:hypothetical protein